MAILTVAIDLAKNVFAVHAVNETGAVQLRQPKVARGALDALPRQAEYQGVELGAGEFQRRSGAGARCQPHEAPGVQPPRRAPDAEAVVREQLQPRGPRVGEQVTTVRASLAERADHRRPQPFCAGARVHRLRAQPQRVDADRFSAVPASSLSQAAQDWACEVAANRRAEGGEADCRAPG